MGHLVAEDFRIRTSWRTHRKRKRVLRMFGAAGIIAVEDLWSYAASEKPSGDLGSMTAEDIADEVNHEGDPGEFVGALAGVIGLLDEKPGGGWVIHDWAEHQHWVVGENARIIAGRANGLKRWHNENKHGIPVKDCPLCPEVLNSSNGPAIDGYPLGAQYSQPSPANPSQSQPSTVSSWKLGEPISAPNQLQDVAGGLGLATDVTRGERKKLAAILVGGDIEPHEIEYAITATRTRGEKPGAPVAFFLGVIIKEREQAAGEVQAPGGAPPPAPRAKTSDEIDDEIVAEAQREIDARKARTHGR